MLFTFKFLISKFNNLYFQNKKNYFYHIIFVLRFYYIRYKTDVLESLFIELFVNQSSKKETHYFWKKAVFWYMTISTWTFLNLLLKMRHIFSSSVYININININVLIVSISICFLVFLIQLNRTIKIRQVLATFYTMRKLY